MEVINNSYLAEALVAQQFLHYFFGRKTILMILIYIWDTLNKTFFGAMNSKCALFSRDTLQQVNKIEIDLYITMYTLPSGTAL